MQNALTIDVEDYYQVSNFEKQIDRAHWPGYASRVVTNTERLLELLARHGVQATFYILGYVAEQHPELVRHIDAAGHEIGSHSYWHRLVYDLSPDEFRDDLRRSRDVLQNLTGKPVTTFRAPSFSITKRSLWALEILAEEGFTTDSSIFPVRHGRYGIPDAPCEPHALQFAAGQLWEFPVTVYRAGKLANVPIAGGGYFRLFPLAVTMQLLRRVNVRHHRPFVFYVHPWEFDPQQPRLRAGSRIQRFRHYVNLSTTEAKLTRMLKEFHFGRLDHVLAAYLQDGTEAPASLAVAT